MAQSNVSKALDRLERSQLISTRERTLLTDRYDEMAKGRQKPSAISEEPYHWSDYELLGLIVQAKQFSTSGTSAAFDFSPMPGSSRHLPEAAIRSEIDSFITLLYSAGLISDNTRDELVSKNNCNEFGWQLNAANYAYEVSNEEYFLEPWKLKRFIYALDTTKVMTDEHYREVLDRSANGQLHHFKDLLPYLDFFTAIPLKEHTGDSLGALNYLYAAASKVFPGLQYDSIKFRVQQDRKESVDDFVVYNMITTLWRKGRAFTYASFYTADFKGKSDKDSILCPDQFYQVFNKILADISSPYRLHSVTIDPRTFGIIALTEQQFEQLNWTYDGAAKSYVQVSFEHYTNKITQKRIGEALALYDSIGLFSHLSHMEKDSGMKEVEQNQMNNYSDILKSFKNLVFDIDLKYGVDDGQYRQITKQIALASRHRFLPKHIIDTYAYENKHFRYGFTLNNKKYAAFLYQEGKWLDPKFWELIEKAMEENDHTGKFHNIYPSDGLTEIYLTDEQFAFLKEHHLLEFLGEEVE
jgi:hypothetical protein